MRKGILLSEAPPQEVMDSCNVDSLESAFLIFSQKQISVNTVTIIYLQPSKNISN